MSELITISGADVVGGTFGGYIDGTDLYPNGFSVLSGIFNGKVSIMPDDTDTSLSDYDIEIIAKRAAAMMVVIDNLDSTEEREVLSANMGRILNEKIETHTQDEEIHVTQSQKDKWDKLYTDFYSYLNSDGGTIDRIKEVFDFLSGVDVNERFVNVVSRIDAKIAEIEAGLETKVDKETWDENLGELQGRIGVLENKKIELGETSDTAYAGDKGKELADKVFNIEEQLADGVGKIQGIIVNGTEVEPDADGMVNIALNSVEVDDSFDIDSTNAIQNGVVTAKFNTIENNTLEGSDVEIDEENNTVTVKLLGKKDVITEFTIPAGSGGGGGGESTTAKVVLNASVSKSVIKEGGSSVLTYFYDHQYSSGEDAGMSTGQKGTISIEIKLGTLTLYSETITDASAGTYTLDLTKYLSVGTVEVYLKATALNPLTDKTQSKQAYVTVKVLQLDLTTSYNVYNSVSDGGYDSGSVMTLPYTIKGSGEKTITLLVDGKQYDSSIVKRSGTTNGSFSISMDGLSIGRHYAVMYAEVDSGEATPLVSQSIYVDFYKAGLSEPIIAFYVVDENGNILESPIIYTEQYQKFELEYAVYDANSINASITIGSQSLTASRRKQSYSGRYKEAGDYIITFSCGKTSEEVKIIAEPSDIDIIDTTYGITLDLSAEGRSNSEANKDSWTYGDYSCTFKGFDWSSDGWDGESITVKNGASIEIPYYLFEKDASTDGATIEIEYMTSNASDKEEILINCFANNVGFKITAQDANMYSGSTKEVEDDDGNKTTQPVGVGRQYGEDEWNRATFVLGKKTAGRLMELYVNSIRVAADVYNSSDIFQQEDNAPIFITAEGADIKIKTIRIYNRPLSDREVVDNYIYSRSDAEEMVEEYNKNNITNDDDTVSFEALRSQGKAIVRFIRSGGLDPVNAENNKKTDFLCDKVEIWLPDGRYIELYNVYIRIQGTSSTKYPSKNYRIYCKKGQEPQMFIDGEEVDAKKFALEEGQPEVSILCLKADYSDASMTQNTGGAIIWDKVCKALGWLTPAQKRDKSKRNSVYGIPIDVFSSETETDTPVYYGQYNLNHDKSDWYDLIGMTDAENEMPISIEFLNNMQPLCLFQSETKLEAQFEEQFEDALEFNYPKDLTWGTANEQQQAALLRLWSWIRNCVPEGASYDDLSTFKSDKFKAEYEEYLDKDIVLGWYCFTDIHGMVDQRVKNTIWVTYDGKKWMVIYYDGDTQMGDRNDSMLAYDYLMSRDTWDAEKSKYAFEGHDSVLWCLILANLEDELKETMDTLRTQLSKDLVYEVFDERQSGNWCATTYNKSGEMKYIIPQTEGVMINGSNVKYPYIYALKGDKKAFRHWYIDNRYMYIDAKYNTASFRSDNIDMYLTRKATDMIDFLRVTATERYFFGYGTNNAPYLFPAVEADTDEIVSMPFSAAYTVNDPIRVYGASRIKKLDLSDLSDIITGDINLNKCVNMEELDVHVVAGYSSGWCMVLDNCSKLTRVNLNGQKNARTGTISSTELNFEGQTRLQYLDARGTTVQSVVFAKGGQIKEAHLGSNIKTLTLDTLPNLKTENITLEDWSTVEIIKIANCPYIDVEELLAKCTNLKRIRIENVDLYGDGDFLEKYKSLQGVDENGSAVSYPAITGSYEFDYMLSEDEIQSWCSIYKELDILNSKYTCYSISTSISDSFKLSNHDNKTGYLYGVSYEPSGHSEKIFENSPMYACDYSRSKKLLTAKELDDSIEKYKDGSVFDLSKNVLKLIPTYWYKGVEDVLNKRQNIYIAYKKPDDVSRTIINEKKSEELFYGKTTYASDAVAGNDIRQVNKYDDSSCETALFNTEDYDFIRVDVSKSQEPFGCIFADDEYKIISTTGDDASYNFDGVEYVIFDVPSNAKYALITKLLEKTIYGCVGKTNECVEEWIERKEFFCGAEMCIDTTNKNDSIYVLSQTGLMSNSADTNKLASWDLDENFVPKTTSMPSDIRWEIFGDWIYRARSIGYGWNIMDYESYKDLVLLWVCYTGSVSSKAYYTSGFNSTKSVLYVPNNYSAEKTNKLWKYRSFKGIKYFPSFAEVHVDGILFGVSSYNKSEKNSFKVPSSEINDNRQNVSIKNFATKEERNLSLAALNPLITSTSITAEFSSNFKNLWVNDIRFGRYCDILPRSVVSTETGARGCCYSGGAGSSEFVNCVKAGFYAQGYYATSIASANTNCDIFGINAEPIAKNANTVWPAYGGYRLCYYGDYEIKK